MAFSLYSGKIEIQTHRNTPMIPNFKDSILTARAFLCATKNDKDGLLECCDQGFDINTARISQSYDPKTLACIPIEFEETVPSIVLRLQNWSMLADLIDRFGAENLVMNDRLTPDPSHMLRSQTMERMQPRWSNLEEYTFESSAAHFCFWQITRPGANINSTPQLSLQAELLSYVGTNPFLVQKQKDLNLFFQNCAALEQQGNLNAHLDKVKEDKPSSNKPSLI